MAAWVSRCLAGRGRGGGTKAGPGPGLALCCAAPPASPSRCRLAPHLFCVAGAHPAARPRAQAPRSASAASTPSTRSPTATSSSCCPRARAGWASTWPPPTPWSSSTRVGGAAWLCIKWAWLAATRRCKHGMQGVPRGRGGLLAHVPAAPSAPHEAAPRASRDPPFPPSRLEPAERPAGAGARAPAGPAQRRARLPPGGAQHGGGAHGAGVARGCAAGATAFLRPRCAAGVETGALGSFARCAESNYACFFTEMLQSEYLFLVRCSAPSPSWCWSTWWCAR